MAQRQMRCSARYHRPCRLRRANAQRRLPSRFPFLRHFPLRKHALSPGWASKFPCICGLFARNLDGAGAEWSGARRWRPLQRASNQGAAAAGGVCGSRCRCRLRAYGAPRPCRPKSLEGVIEVLAADNALLDALLVAIAAAITADPMLGGAVEWAQPGSADIEDVEFEVRPARVPQACLSLCSLLPPDHRWPDRPPGETPCPVPLARMRAC